jgi:hypothetical protein
MPSKRVEKGGIALYWYGGPMVFNIGDIPRTARVSVAGMWYHVLNRGNRREPVFHKPGDHDAFVEAMTDAGTRVRSSWLLPDAQPFSVGSGRACPDGSGDIRICETARCRSATSIGWSGSTSHSQPGTSNDCGTRYRAAGHMEASHEPTRQQPASGWSRACVCEGGHGRTTDQSAMSPFSRVFM